MKTEKSITGICLNSSLYAHTQDISAFYLEKQIIKASAVKEIVFTYPNAQYQTNFTEEKTEYTIRKSNT